jgi:uncharacterized protein (TIGR03067 family)
MRMLSLALLLLAAGAVAADNPVDVKANRTDRDSLQGTWKIESVHGFQKASTREEMDQVRLKIEGNTIHAVYGDKSAEATFTLDAVALPRQIDITVTKGPAEVQMKLFRGIYLLEGNTLRIAYRKPGEERPREFGAGEPGVYRVFLKKVKK